MLAPCCERDANDVGTERQRHRQHVNHGRGLEAQIHCARSLSRARSKAAADVLVHREGRCRHQNEQHATRAHDDHRARPLLVIQIVKHDGSDQKGGDGRTGTLQHRESRSEQQHHHGHDAGCASRRVSGGNRALTAVFSIKLGIGDIIEDHAAGVEQ